MDFEEALHPSNSKIYFKISKFTYMENVTKDIFPKTFTKVIPLRNWQLENAFKTQLNIFRWSTSLALELRTASELIFKRFKYAIPVYLNYKSLKY